MQERVTATFSSEYIALPESFLEMINLQLNTNPVTNLQYMPPEVMDIRYGGQSDVPKYYAIVGDEIQVAPPPAGSYDIEMEYYKRLTPLATSANWLFTNHPDLYLYATLMEAATFTKDDSAFARWAQLYQTIMDSLMKADDRTKWSGSTLTMRAV